VDVLNGTRATSTNSNNTSLPPLPHVESVSTVAASGSEDGGVSNVRDLFQTMDVHNQNQVYHNTYNDDYSDCIDENSDDTEDNKDTDYDEEQIMETYEQNNAEDVTFEYVALLDDDIAQERETSSGAVIWNSYVTEKQDLFERHHTILKERPMGPGLRPKNTIGLQFQMTPTNMNHCWTMTLRASTLRKSMITNSRMVSCL
jgi:hypothetical protein